MIKNLVDMKGAIDPTGLYFNDTETFLKLLKTAYHFPYFPAPTRGWLRNLYERAYYVKRIHFSEYTRAVAMIRSSPLLDLLKSVKVVEVLENIGSINPEERGLFTELEEKLYRLFPKEVFS